MELKDKKEIIYKALDNLRERVGKLPDQVTDLGAIVMAGANLWKEGQIDPTGEAVGDENALKECIIYAMATHAARAFVQDETPIADTINTFAKALRSDRFLNLATMVIERIS
jgi:hypothetical protein